MALFKKKLDEQEAALEFLRILIKEVRDRWPNIYQVLKEGVHGESFIVQDEEVAKYDLFLASVALRLQAVKNLFQKDQAERIERFILQYGFTENDLSEYAINEIQQYGEQFQKALQNLDNPSSAISERLVQRWLGKNIDNFIVEIAGGKIRQISPILLMEVSTVLVSFPANFSWKKLKDNFNLVPGDLPLDT